MDKKYEAFRIRQSQRRKTFLIILILMIVGIFLGGVLINYNLTWFSYWTTILLLGFLAGFMYAITRPWAYEWYETNVFVNMYEAFKFLEQCANEDRDSLFSLKKANNKIRDAIRSVGSWRISIQQSSSKLIRKEYADPVKNLEDNLRTRILPRIAQYKDIGEMKSIVWRLANLFSEVQKTMTLNDITSMNKELECYEVIELEETPNRIRTILNMEPMKLLGSILLGFLITCMSILIHSYIFQTDLLDLISSLTNFLGILAVGIALGLGIYEVSKRKVR